MITPTRGRRGGAGSSKIGVAERAGGDADVKRAALIAAAVDLFSMTPYEDVSIDALTDRAKIAHGMVSYHFGSKRGLFAEAVASVWDEFIAFTGPSPSENSPRQMVRGYIRRQFDYAATHPQRYAFMHSKHGDTDVSEILERARRLSSQRIESALGCAANPTAEFTAAMTAWHGFIEGAISTWVTDTTIDAEVLIDACMSVLTAAVNATNGVLPSREAEDEVLAQVAGR